MMQKQSVTNLKSSKNRMWQETMQTNSDVWQNDVLQHVHCTVQLFFKTVILHGQVSKSVLLHNTSLLASINLN